MEIVDKLAPQSLTHAQQRCLEGWAHDAEIAAAGVVAGHLHVLVDNGPGWPWRWTDRIVFDHGIVHYQPACVASWMCDLGVPEPDRVAREVTQEIALADGWVADGLLEQMSRPLGAAA